MQFTIRFPAAFSSADALQRALYRVADQGSWDVALDGESWVVIFKVNSDLDRNKVESNLRQHIVDYGLREKIRKETEQTRALLLAHAFSGVSGSK